MSKAETRLEDAINREGALARRVEPRDGAGPPAPSLAPTRQGAVWDAHAAWWKATFTDGADPEYERVILPLVADELAGATRILDIGCGEGQVARHLLERAPQGALVVGLDPSSAQLANARHAGGGPWYVQAEGEGLPFGAGSFDAVVCCLSIEHARDVDAVLEEAARVLCEGGCLLLVVNHPLFQGSGSGLIDDQILGEAYWRIGPYLEEAVAVEEVDPGVAIEFAHRPLSRYVNPLGALDVVLVALREPAPALDLLAGSVAPALEAAIPRLAALRFERRMAAPRGSGDDGASTHVPRER